MILKYNTRTQTTETLESVDNTDQLEKRTKAFIQWVKFNKSNAADMALAVLRQPKMRFLTNCEMAVDTDVKCQGFNFGKPFCYGWKDEYFELINKARQFYWRYAEQKTDNKKTDKKND